MPYAPLPGRLDLIASGDGADGYADLLGTFSWRSFYAESCGGEWVEEARRQWISSYDFVLIDSRTGLSDVGGICTIQLPDTLVLVFVANDQSFEGGIRVVKAAQRARRNFGYDRGQLNNVPLLSRWCGDEETDIAKVWLRRFDQGLPVQVASWLPKTFSPRDFLEKVRVPHVARFTFGEPLPVLTHSVTDPMLPGLAFDLLCRLLASNMAEVGKIIDPSYEPKFSFAPHETLSRGEGLRVYISAVASEFGQARDALEADLHNRGINSRSLGYFPPSSGRSTLHVLHDFIRECDVVICLVGLSGGPYPSDAETEPFSQFLPPRITVASYTQWEFFFAQYYRRKILVYTSRNQHELNKNRAMGSLNRDLHLQTAFFSYINASGYHYVYFSSIEELRANVAKQDWPQSKPSRPIFLPYPSLGSLFKGRDPFLRRLRASFVKGNTGGVAIVKEGSSALAASAKPEPPWSMPGRTATTTPPCSSLDAETPDKLHTALAALAAPLRLPAATAQEEAVRFEAVLDWLNANPTWLLIFDNIDTEPALAAAHHLLGRLAGGHVLMTSRLTQFPRGVERLDLDVLSLDDATSFLLEATETGRHRHPR